MKMIRLLLALVVASLIMGCIAQEQKFILNESNSDLVGTWEFVKRLDEYGNKN